jgi:hypothetical protein
MTIVKEEEIDDKSAENNIPVINCSYQVGDIVTTGSYISIWCGLIVTLKIDYYYYYSFNYSQNLSR